MSNEGDENPVGGSQGNGQGRPQTADERGRVDEGKPVESVEMGEPGELLTALQAERDEIKDRMLRIAAEFENWKKRARKEQEEAEAKARESVLRDMLDVMDNLERAMGAYGQADKTGATPGEKSHDKSHDKSHEKSHEKAKKGREVRPGADVGSGAPPDAQGVLKGVELVMRLFQSKLERYGIKPIVAAGQPFDPRLHEAISRVETTDVPPGHVAVEMQRGYRTGDRLLRPSMVGVAVAPTRVTGAGGVGGGGGGGGPQGGNDFESGNGIGKDGA